MLIVIGSDQAIVSPETANKIKFLQNGEDDYVEPCICIGNENDCGEQCTKCVDEFIEEELGH